MKKIILIITLILVSCNMTKAKEFSFEDYDMDNPEQEAERMKQDLLAIHPIGSSVKSLEKSIILGGGVVDYLIHYLNSGDIVGAKLEKVFLSGRKWDKAYYEFDFVKEGLDHRYKEKIEEISSKEQYIKTVSHLEDKIPYHEIYYLEKNKISFKYIIRGNIYLLRGNKGWHVNVERNGDKIQSLNIKFEPEYFGK